MSKPLRSAASPALGISYGYTVQNVTTLTNAANTYYNYIDFLNINGPNPLNGITTIEHHPELSHTTR